jgi:methionine--tRNA ligase beta chain
MEGHKTEESRPGAGQPAAGQSAAASLITFDDFLKVHLRVAKVVEAMDHPKADKLLVLKVDLGGEQRQLVAGIKGHYQPQDLVGRNIVVVTNLQPRMMRGYESQGMLLAAVTEAQDKIVLVTVDKDVPPGTKVS